MHRINNIAMLCIVACAGLIQSTAFEYINVLGIKPDLLLIVVIFFALSCQREDAIKTAVSAGLIKDITSSLIFGSYTISFLLIALSLNYHQSKFYKERIATQVLISFICYIFMGSLALFFNTVSQKTYIYHYPYLSILLKGGLYTGIIAPFLFFTLSKILGVRLTPSF